MGDGEQREEREKELRSMSVEELLKQALLRAPADLREPELAEDEEDTDE